MAAGSFLPHRCSVLLLYRISYKYIYIYINFVHAAIIHYSGLNTKTACQDGKLVSSFVTFTNFMFVSVDRTN